MATKDQAAGEGGRKSEVVTGGVPETVACKSDGAEASSRLEADLLENYLAKREQNATA